MADVMVTLAVMAAAAWLAVALYLGYRIESDVLGGHPRSAREARRH